MIESDLEKSSDTSDELSVNSETYDFLMVYMPMIRPKEDSENEDLKVVDSKSPTKKGTSKKLAPVKSKKSTVSAASTSLQLKGNTGSPAN